MQLYHLLLILLVAHSANAFHASKLHNKVVSATKLNERFNLDFSNPKIESDPLIFTEKQLREFTSEYSTDFRLNPLTFVLGLFNKSEPEPEPEPIPEPVKKVKKTLKSPKMPKLPSLKMPSIKLSVPKPKAAPKPKATKSAVKVTANATGGNMNGKRYGTNLTHILTHNFFIPLHKYNSIC